MYSEEMVGIVRQDSLRQCMARATGVSRGSVRIRETLSEENILGDVEEENILGDVALSPIDPSLV